MLGAGRDVAIVGGGIVGAACALECAAAGLEVVIIEADMVGSGATAAGMGHIVVMDDSEAQFTLTRYSQQLWRALAAELPQDVEYDLCGTIWVAADAEEMAEAQRKHDYYRARGVPAEVLDARALRAAEPRLREGLAGGLLVPEDAVVYPPCAARYFLEQAKARGTQVVIGQAVEITSEGVRLADGRRIPADMTVNAAGAWSPALTPGLDIKKRKGHLVITDRYPGRVRHQLVELGYLKSAHSTTADSVAFNVQPRRTGQLLIGSSRQYGAEHKEVDAQIVSRMLNRACDYLPGLAGMAAIRTWTGFRAATPDKLPLIGPWDEKRRVWLATGHEGLGITTSLGTAKLLAAQITGRAAEISAEPYLPHRVHAHAQ